MRGISGSGKSTLAKKLGQGGVIFSTDDYFEDGNKYNFDSTKLPEFHKANQDRAIKAMQQGITPIVIDNTHVESWEAKPYVEAGMNYGYKIKFAKPETSWAFNAEELARRNSHGVPLQVIQSMLNKWEPNMNVDSILKSQEPKGPND